MSQRNPLEMLQDPRYASETRYYKKLKNEQL